MTSRTRTRSSRWQSAPRFGDDHCPSTPNPPSTTIHGTGTGPIDGFVDALSKHVGIDLSVLDYSEHSLQRGSNAAAISYVEMEHPGGKLFGAGINTNIVAASLEAVGAAANRILAARGS